MNIRTEKTACILCSRNCGLQVEVNETELVRIKGDTEHPQTKGYICQKAARLNHYQNHQDRLSQPLQRQADGSFKTVGWDEALQDIADRLLNLRNTHGGDAFAFVGGGGQGNHLGGAYSRQLLAAMKSRYVYNALAQEKTGDFWVNGRLFGSQSCHTTEDVEHADYVLFIGTNPYQAHGIPNARDTLRDLKKDPNRTMVVVDPRRSETAQMADIHLQLKPGSDAFLLAAMLAIIVTENLHDHAFLKNQCTGFEDLRKVLVTIPIERFVEQTDLTLQQVQEVARGFANAATACVRIDLGLQQTLNSTLNSYLEKLLFLVTGNFGKKGGNNLHTMFLPILGNTDERREIPGKKLKRTAHHGMQPIAGLYPPNILPDEIEHKGDNRIRAVFVDSANPLLTFADSKAYARAFSKLELLVVVDTALTETARLAHYILPASSQFEKWEATGFNLEFPDNGFHLRHPLFKPFAESLGEPEIYTRILEKMNVLPTIFPKLRALAAIEPEKTGHLGYMAALGLALARKPKWVPFAASIMYRSLGPSLAGNAAATAPLLALSIAYAQTHYRAVKAAGYEGNRLTLGSALFRKILESRSGMMLSKHRFDEMKSLIKYSDKKVHLNVPEMLQALKQLEPVNQHNPLRPFVLLAGERRTYNANQIYRNPAWRKVDQDGAMRMHPKDAERLNLMAADKAVCTSDNGEITVTIELDENLRQGMVTLPHGYGMRYANSQPIGPEINQLTSGSHTDPWAKTPLHKYVPVAIKKLTASV